MKNKVLIYGLSIFLFLLAGGFILNKIGATSFFTDSGFDSSYDSGGSFSYDSGSSSSYDSGSSYSSGASSSASVGDVTILVFILILILVLILMSKGSKSANTISVQNSVFLNHSNELKDEYIRTIIPNFDSRRFLSDRLIDFCDIQYSWMDFKYDKLREKLTDELYNQYEMQLNTLKAKGEKNIMKNLQAKDMMITNVSNINGKYEVTMELVISFFDYIEQNGIVVRGNTNMPITMYYELVFVSSSLATSTDICPHCGAPLSDNASQVCEYCNSTITRISNKWVLSKKRAKGQK